MVVRKTTSGRVTLLFLAVIGCVLNPVFGFMTSTARAAVPAEDAALALARQNYHDALIALDQRRWQDFDDLRARLQDYPLAIYLDYYRLSRQAHQLSPAEANAFLQRSSDTPLPPRFLSVYLGNMGKREKWSNFLAVQPDEPNSTVLKCYYYRAQLAAGNKDAAWAGAAKLWTVGRSQVKECDPLFEAWMDAGQLSDAHVWARMLAAFDQRQSSLMTYVARSASDELQPWTEKLRQVYRKPEQLRSLSLPADSSYSSDIAQHGLAYLARYSPDKALEAWAQLQSQLEFSAEQRAQIEYEIALRALFARDEAHADWLHGALDRLDNDKLTGIRLRWALAEEDWDTLDATLPLLSEEQRAEGEWRYWLARMHEQRGESEQAAALLQALAAERSYYGFLAADKLGQPYEFNISALPEITDSQLPTLPVVRRIEELHYHDEYTLAHSEWYKLLSDTQDKTVKLQLARLAQDRGWYRMGIDAATKSDAWDALDVRFPLAYQTVFDHHAGNQQVPATELMAIARRESAFFPWARSPVGARGLMQIMPATGKQVAASINEPHRTADLNNVEHNVLLGSTYYRQLLERYDGNRIFALTAYNAGPHRVDRWRNEVDEAVPVDLWVETIPFRETRNYVQAVLAYNVVFRYRMGEDRLSMLTPLEKQASY